MLEKVQSYISMGGFVMPSLLLVGMTLWTLIGLRMQLLKRGFKGDMVKEARKLFVDPAEAHSAGGLLGGFLGRGVHEVRHGVRAEEALDELILESERDLSAYKRIIRSLCGVAPLLGLLGTVSGMIETFWSLTSMELFSQGGGVATGIAEALISTQMGLIVAIPGVIVGRLLDRKEEALRTEIQRAREHLMLTAVPPLAREES